MSITSLALWDQRRDVTVGSPFACGEPGHDAGAIGGVAVLAHLTFALDAG
jgi:hypothetical protein